MTFRPRTQPEILDDMLAYVALESSVTDFNPGSVNRTLLEANAIEHAETYTQMVRLRDAFRLVTATGRELEERAGDYGVVRLQARPASGFVAFTDELLIRSTLLTNAAAGALSLTLASSAAFPTSGYPYTIRIGEGLPTVEDVQVTANNGLQTLTLASGLLYAHASSESVSLVAGSARTLRPGIRVQVPATTTSPAITYVTTTTATLTSGNYESSPASIRCEVPGTAGNVGARQIRAFASARPFAGAGVINQSPISNGRNVETDDELKERTFSEIRSLSRSVPIALRAGLIGVEDEASGQRITSASLRESKIDREVTAYVDNGTGVRATRTTLPVTVFSAPVLAGAASFTVADASALPASGSLVLSGASITTAEIIDYTAVDYVTNTLTISGVTQFAHAQNDTVTYVEPVLLVAEAGQRFCRLGNVPVVRNSYALWLRPVGGLGLATRAQDESDYVLNRGTGDIEFASGLTEGVGVWASYSYYTGVLAAAQRTLNGDPAAPTFYPGLRAAGVCAVVDAPIVRRIRVRGTLAVSRGERATVVTAVRSVIESYISGLGQGAEVVLLEICGRVREVSGVSDFVLQEPRENIQVLEFERPTPFDANGNSLVIVG